MRCLLGLFVWPVGSHLVWMMAAVRVPLASVTPTMAAWSHVAYSASCSGCVALQWAWLIVAEVSTSLARTTLNAARVSATLATTMVDHGKQKLRAAGYFDHGCNSPTVASVTVTSIILETLCGLLPLWLLHRLTDCGESDFGDQSSFDCWCSKLSLWWSLLVGHRPWWTQRQQVWLTAGISKTQLSIVRAALLLAEVECGTDKLWYSCNQDTHWWVCFRSVTQSFHGASRCKYDDGKLDLNGRWLHLVLI